MRLDPNSLISLSHKLDSNWRPRSVVTVEGRPNRAIQPLTKARATVSAVMSGIGIASGESVDTGEKIGVAFGGGKWPNNINVDLVKAYIRRCERGEWSNCVTLYL